MSNQETAIRDHSKLLISLVHIVCYYMQSCLFSTEMQREFFFPQTENYFFLVTIDILTQKTGISPFVLVPAPFYSYPDVRTRGSGHRLEPSFPLNIRKHFCVVSTTEHWDRLSREAEEPCSLDIFKTFLNVAKVSLLEQRAWAR